MASRYLVSRVDRFAGLSDRSVPVQLSRIESPSLLNIDFSDRTLTRRKGFSRLNSEQFKDSSLFLDGYRSFAVIPHLTDYDASNRAGISFHCKLNAMPAAEVTVLSRGYGTGANRWIQISYDPTINTNLGGWRCRVYDATNTTLRNVTVNDGDALFSHIGKTRQILFDYSGSSDVHDFTVYDENGSSVGTTNMTVAAFVTDSFDFIVGVDTTDGLTIPAEGDSSYASISIAEIRMEFTTGTSTALSAFGRELRVNAAENEITASPALDGYWKCNDGNGSTLSDSTASANSMVIGSNGATWATDTTKINGTHGLEFHGERGHVQVDATNVAAHVFSDTERWAFTFLFTPKLAQGETTVRDQTLLWCGATASDPEPLGVVVESDALKVYFQDTTSTKSVTLTTMSGGASAAMSTYADNKIRVVVERVSTTLYVGVFIDDGTATGVLGQNSTTIGATAITPSNDWAIGRKVTSFVEPVTFATGVKSAFCYLDDFAFFKDYNANATTMFSGWIVSLASTFSAIANIEFSSISQIITGNLAIHNVWSLALNDGSGQSLATTGSKASTAVLLPSSGTAFSWDVGLVTPDSAPEITLLRDFRRLDSKGNFKRNIVAISGTTLYEIDPSDGSQTAVVGNLPKGGKWSHAQYSDKLFLACDNGERPIVYDGTGVNQVGIDAPVTKAVATTSTSGGTMIAATYYVYVTFRNATTGVESNPSPGNTLTIASGTTGSITALKIPRSSDPQVNQRRVWITAAGGADGSAAYLSATIDDNTTTNYTTAITAVGTTPTLEYLTNEPAPQGSLVQVFKDRLWVGGNSTYPTRAFYSTAGTLTSFYSTTQFLDVDQDAGDPIVGMKGLRDQLICYLRDGRVAITPTGDSTEPFILTRTNQDVGAVSEHSILVYENRHIFLGERDVWIWSGEDAQNISSPLEEDRPSVKNYVRDSISDAYKSNASIALDRSRDQLWLSVTTGSNTRNNEILVLDISQGVWSRYLMDMDCLAEIEDDNDEPTLYGASWGYVCKLNDGKFDGEELFVTPSAGVNANVIVKSGATWTVDAFKGLYVTFFDNSTGVTDRVRVARNTATTMYLVTSLSAVPTTTDSVYIGSIPWKAEFVADFGNPMSLKRIRWVKIAGFRNDTDGTDPVIRVLVEPNINQRAWPLTSPSLGYDTWADADVLKDFRFGGLGRLFRIMISSGSGATNDLGEPTSRVSDQIHVTEFQVEAEELSAR